MKTKKVYINRIKSIRNINREYKFKLMYYKFYFELLTKLIQI